jgi:hypothetical protein
LWNRTLLGSRAYFDDGTARSLPTGFGDHALNYYFEYGITDRWTLVSSGTPIGFSVFAGDRAVYMGALELGMRRGLVQGTWNLAVEARYGYAPPVGERALGAGVIEGNAYTYTPAIETHMLTADVQLGRGIGRGWITAHVGARWYSREGIDAALVAGLQGGYSFAFGLQVALSITSQLPFGVVTTTNVTGVGQTRYAGFALDLSYWFTPHWAITAGIGGAPFAWSNAGAMPLLLGIEHR